MGKSLCIGSTEGYKIHEGFKDEEGIGGIGLAVAVTVGRYFLRFCEGFRTQCIHNVIAVCILLIPSLHTN